MISAQLWPLLLIALLLQGFIWVARDAPLWPFWRGKPAPERDPVWEEALRLARLEIEELENAVWGRLPLTVENSTDIVGVSVGLDGTQTPVYGPTKELRLLRVPAAREWTMDELAVSLPVEGVDYEIIEYPWDSTIHEVKNGCGDVVMRYCT
jgi:hypothetical protein